MKVVGLMSGTSGDGLDIALCDISGAPPKLEAKIIAGTTIPYSDAMQQRIFKACHPQNSTVTHISELHTDFGKTMGEAVHAFLEQHNQTADLIASHGQTIWHNVDDRGVVTSTLQIGSAAHIAEITGITTIHDFRSRDVAAGGQGAPLTAYVDWLLLRHPIKTRAIQNIGGIGNVSVLPPLNNDTAPLLAFDTGAGNVLIDSAVTILTDGAMTYDKDGMLASRGTVNTDWLEDLMQHNYYHRPPPKTTGRELFSPPLAQQYIDEGKAQKLDTPDIIATFTALTAYSIAHAYQVYVPTTIDEVIIGGGGARNPTLMQMLRDLLAPIPVLNHDDIGLNSDYKEALVFAVLGYETWHHRVGTMPSQTGAHHASVLGSITPAKNYVSLLKSTLQDFSHAY